MLECHGAANTWPCAHTLYMYQSGVVVVLGVRSLTIGIVIISTSIVWIEKIQLLPLNTILLLLNTCH